MKVSQSTFSAQQEKTSEFFNKLGSMMNLDIENNHVDQIAWSRIQSLEDNPKTVLFDSRINGLDQRGILVIGDRKK